MKNLSFMEYMESKNTLKNSIPPTKKFIEKYILMKYCRVPVLTEDEDESEFISFKPKDVIQVLKEEKINGDIVIKNFSSVHEGFCSDPTTFKWSQSKVESWLDNTCAQIDK